MGKTRLEAFSDGVLAIVITIMVLELRVPEGGHDLAALRPLLPMFLSYVLSFVHIGLYWNNHHHMLHATHQVRGRILWANLHLLFWLSLVPFTTHWVGESPNQPWPAAVYGSVLLMAAIAYYLLQSSIVALEGPGSTLARAVGSDWKGKTSPVLYVLAIGLAFVHPWLSYAIYVLNAMLWLIPDRRIERRLDSPGGIQPAVDDRELISASSRITPGPTKSSTSSGTTGPRA